MDGIAADRHGGSEPMPDVAGDIIFTADVHINPRHPERLERFRYILDRALLTSCRHVVVAGDLFDQDAEGYHALERLLKEQPYREITVTAIPGNHDAGLRSGLVAASNFRVHEQPVREVLAGHALLFVPYRSKSNLQNELLDAAGIETGKPTIVSHGDVVGGEVLSKGDEAGAYFPMEAKDIGRFRAQRAILGHIHAKYELFDGLIRYPGSPFPLDSSEVGIRRYLVLRHSSPGGDGTVESVPIPVGPIYLKIDISVIPDLGEEDQVRRAIQVRLMEVRDSLQGKTLEGEIHLTACRVVGFSKTSRAQVLKSVTRATEQLAGDLGLRVLTDSEPDGEMLEEASADPLRADLMRDLLAEVRKLPESLPLPEGSADIRRSQLEQAAMCVLYGRPSR